MAKIVALHDYIEIDGTDWSNAFSQFSLDSTDSDVDVSGFSESGTDETLSGTRAEGFTGQAFYSEEFATAMWTLHNTREVFRVLWQPNGLVDSSAIPYYAECQLRNFNPANTRGSASTMPISFKVADPVGVRQGTGS